MCGIAGYVGYKVATPFVLDCLQKLEYRGYDSAGIAFTQNDSLCRLRVLGGVDNLKRAVSQDVIDSSVMIGHTRWATHGRVSVENAHPQMSNHHDVAVVHNGIIENFDNLKAELQSTGVTFESQTDTEIIPNMIHNNLTGYTDTQILDALQKTTRRLQGSFALCVLVSKVDKIFATARFSPLLFVKSDYGFMVASDLGALPNGEKYKLLDDYFAVISKEGISFFDKDMQPVTLQKLDITNTQQDEGHLGFDSYMAKEVSQGGDAIRNTCKNLIESNALDIACTELFTHTFRIVITACGTALHAGRILGYMLQKECGIECVIDYASEFRYFPPHIDEETVCIFISQSGETADTLSCVEFAKTKQARTLGITNVPTSRLAGMVDYCILSSAGAERAVASTKVLMAQLAIIYMLVQKICKILNKSCEFSFKDILDCANKLDRLKSVSKLDKITRILQHKQSLFVLGRGLDYLTALEGALKIKEVSYIHCEALPLGELKHGSLALFNNDSYCIVLMTQKHLMAKTINNIHEITTRGAHVILITNMDVSVDVDYVIKIDCQDTLSPIPAIKVLQILALKLAKIKKIDVDKPRNLAKSVTVE